MKQTFLALAVGATLGLSTSAHAFNVDLFTSGDSQTVQDLTKDGNAVTSTVDESAVGNIMGGERDISVNFLTGTQDGVSRVIMTAGTTEGVLRFSNDDPVGGEGRVQWDGNDSALTLDVTGLAGLNLWSYGSGFSVDVLTADLNFPIHIDAYTDATHYTRVGINTTGPGSEFISFAALENAALCGTSFGPIYEVICGPDGNVDMSDFGALEFVINVAGQTIAVDLSIGPVTIPEPGTLSLLGLGLLGAALPGLRRRRQGKITA